MNHQNIYDYIITEENRFNTPISINGWEWNFKDHIKTAFYYKHGRLLNGNDENTPVKNITRPLLNLQYRAEDIDVKDITLYVDDPDSYHLSFLVKKYHNDVFIVENDLDTFIDEAKEAKVDYGVALVKKGKDARPEVVDLQSIAFCDQTDMLKGPIAFKHFYNPAELLDMEASGWGAETNGATGSVRDMIDLAEKGRRDDKTHGRKSDTPGEYIEIYEVHGVLPKSYLTDSPDDDVRYLRQFHIVGFYHDEEGKKHGITLFRKEEKVSPLKVIVRDKIYSRCAGFGGVEELVEPQVWTNYDEIHKKNILDAASKIVLKSIGASMKSRYPNGLKDVDNLEILDLNEGEDLAQVDTYPRSMVLFEKSVQSWEEHAQKMASASDPLLGEPAPSGTPFRAQERQVIEGKGLHEYRRGKYAKDIEAVYRDWIIPHIVEKVTQGTTFLSELSTEEMQYVSDRMSENEATRRMNDHILDGGAYSDQLYDTFKQEAREGFIKGGNKKFIEILKGEFSRKRLRVKINVKGKQKDLSVMTDKLVNIFRQIIANPQGFQQIMQMPEMAKTFNDILEYSGLSPVYYSGINNQQSLPSPVQPELETSLAENNV